MPTAPPPALTLAWLALLALTLASLGLGEGFAAAPWLPFVVAAIVWLKGWLVARHFLEAPHAHPFIARLVYGFVALAPLALALTAYFGDRLARWATLP